MRRTKDGYELSSGRTFYAYNWMLSLGPEKPRECSYGYDGGIVESEEEDRSEWDPGWRPFTQAEREEIADFMIALWTHFKSPASDPQEP